MQKSKYGEVYWLNIKTLEETMKHPGQEYFRTNLKVMRKHAEAHFKQNILGSLEDKEANLINDEKLKRFSAYQQLKITRIKHILSKWSKGIFKNS